MGPWAVFHKDCNRFNVYFVIQLQNLTVIVSAVIDYKNPLHKTPCNQSQL